jgi:glycosyltransferase involved in cell wall biosynthesis
MKVSFTGAPEYKDRSVGYGEASTHIMNTFEKLGVEVLIKDKSADIGISFIQPDMYLFGKNQYRIGYSPWESTELKFGWDTIMNTVVDEMWATSEWVADIYSHHTTKPIFVYEHGIEDTWIPKERKLRSDLPFRFLHVGEPAYRKDAQSVVDAFISLFGNNPKYELILKCSQINTTKIFDKKTGDVIGSPDSKYNNIHIIESFLTPEQMIGLYAAADVFVYPSWGEGFGFNPLQAMATGMPTICTEAWAPYSRYITMPLDSKWVESPWQHTHPGLMVKPDYAQLKFYMQDVAKNYEKYSKLAYKNAFLIHRDYSWAKVSKPAVERLKKIQKTHF